MSVQKSIFDGNKSVHKVVNHWIINGYNDSPQDIERNKIKAVEGFLVKDDQSSSLSDNIRFPIIQGK